jgi:hypothetical protein
MTEPIEIKYIVKQRQARVAILGETVWLDMSEADASHLCALLRHAGCVVEWEARDARPLTPEEDMNQTLYILTEPKAGASEEWLQSVRAVCEDFTDAYAENVRERLVASGNTWGLKKLGEARKVKGAPVVLGDEIDILYDGALVPALVVDVLHDAFCYDIQSKRAVGTMPFACGSKWHHKVQPERGMKPTHLTAERLRQIIKIADSGDIAECRAMASEILELREDLAKAYHQHQFYADERDRARNDRAELMAEMDTNICAALRAAKAAWARNAAEKEEECA